MELRTYLRILAGKWRIILLAFLVTYGATLAFTFTQAPVYQGRATYIVKLNSAFGSDKDLASAVDILSRRTEIATTYTIVANSRMIKRAAADQLGLTAGQRGDVAVTSELVPGTNVLEINVQAHNPALARDFTNAVGAQTIAYVQDLYETYRLELLDPASASDIPVSPNKPLNLILGAVMGGMLGIGLAFLSAYLQAPLQSVSNFGVLDDETGVYNRRYFMLRLRQELSRAKRTQRPLSVALLNVDHGGAIAEALPHVRREALRRAAARLEQYVREEDVIAYFDQTVFAFVLPDLPGEAAKATIQELQALLAASPLELERSGVELQLHSTAGVADLENTSDEPEDLIAKAQRALNDAGAGAFGSVHLLTSETSVIAA